MNIFKHAASIKGNIAMILSQFEIHCATVFDRPIPKSQNVIAAITDIWPYMIEDAKNSKVTPKVHYVARLYELLVESASIDNPGQFTDRADFPWESFYEEGSGDEPRCEDAWVVSELFWGNYVQNLQLTFGWLLMNAIRLQHNLHSIIPEYETLRRFTDSMRSSGPGSYDAENLRGLFHEYELKQTGRSDLR